jgi:nucleotide-binding universal stress UspA family protein
MTFEIEQRGWVMYANILVGWDGTDRARDALALADVLRAVGGTVTAAYVYRPETRSAADQVLAAAQHPAGDLERIAIPGPSPAQALRALAQDRGVDLLVLGSSCHGVDGRVRAGGVGRIVAADPTCAVAIAPRGFRNRDQRPRIVAVAFDGGDQLPASVPAGAALAKSLDAQLHLLCVVEPFESWARDAGDVLGYRWGDASRVHHDQFEHLLDDASATLDPPADEVRLLERRPLEVLLEDAGRGVDLFVTSAAPCGALHSILMGGRGGALRSVEAPVLVVPCPRRSGTAPAAHLRPAIPRHRQVVLTD